MKVRAGATAAALFLAGASAQSYAPVSYTTVTIDDCPTASMESMITVTNGITVTYCPECEMTPPGYTTTYTTTYMSLCPSGLVPVPYTVTESCTGDRPHWTTGPGHIPNGFTTTEKECTVCGKETPTVTITEPCGCEATEGVPVPPKETPVQQISDGQVQNPTPGNNGQPYHNRPAPTLPVCIGENCGPGPVIPPTSSGSPPCEGDDCGGSGNQSPAYPPSGNQSPYNTPSYPGSNGGAAPPYPTTTPVICPGPDCRAKATGGGSVSGANSPSTSNIAPYSGGTTSFRISFVAVALAAIIVGGLAFLL